jgi:thiosulfate/3-mercaptopyruvate sulfurtransferase
MTDLDRIAAPGREPISTAELRQRLTEPNLVVVDVRPTPAYNGWRLGGESRGGHIPGAVAFPISWLDTVDEIEVERLLKSKRVTPDRSVVLYGDGPSDAAPLRAKLEGLGHPAVRIYEAAGRRGRPTKRCPLNASRSTTGLSIRHGFAS